MVAYLDTAATVSSFLASIAEARVLALDTEGASFHRFVDRIYLLQLSTAETSAIIDPLPLSVADLALLGAMAEDPAVEVIFHDADYDLRLLHQDYGWKVTGIFDTRIAAQLIGLKAFGLAALLERYFGVKLDKKHQRADWSMRPLTADMLDYASLDTKYLIDLRTKLRDELERLGRWTWAQEEFKRLEGIQFAGDEDGTAYMRIKGARDLSRRELALLRELVIWRDGVAAGFDRATFRVAGNEVLLEMARQAPTTREALLAIKGTPRQMVETRGVEMTDAVKRGLAVADAELPRFPKSARWDRDPEFDGRVARLKGARDAAAARLELDPGVLCSRDRLESVARRRPASMDELLEMAELRRWQAELLGPDFLRLLAEDKSPVIASPAAVAAAAASNANGELDLAPPTADAVAPRPRAAPVSRRGAPAAAAAADADADDSPYRAE